MIRQYIQNLKAVFVSGSPKSTANLKAPLDKRLFISQAEWLRDTPRIWRQIHRSDSNAIVTRW